jgi:lipooligosaccharide transport system permease protein
MRRIGRLLRVETVEWSGVQGVLVREVINYSSYWRSSTFSATVEPTVYLLAFGFGFGSLVSTVGGVPYIQFVGTGAVATAVSFSSILPAMFSVFVKYEFQHTYDAMLAAPVDTEEIVTAEALWIGTRAGTYGCFPMIIAMLFGLDPAWGMFAVPFFAFAAGFAFASAGISIAAFINSIDNTSYVTSAVITPLFLVAGTFFPIAGLPEWAQVAAQINPLYHLVELVRHSVFGFEGWEDVWNIGFIVMFGIGMWRLAILGMKKKLID